jgi:hypothetical protein
MQHHPAEAGIAAAGEHILSQIQLFVFWFGALQEAAH